jgi:hypothetical protein
MRNGILVLFVFLHLACQSSQSEQRVATPEAAKAAEEAAHAAFLEHQARLEKAFKPYEKSN